MPESSSLSPLSSAAGGGGGGGGELRVLKCTRVWRDITLCSAAWRCRHGADNSAE